MRTVSIPTIDWGVLGTSNDFRMQLIYPSNEDGTGCFVTCQMDVKKDVEGIEVITDTKVAKVIGGAALAGDFTAGGAQNLETRRAAHQIILRLFLKEISKEDSTVVIP